MDQHFSQDLSLLKLRHSCEHILTEAMEKIYPGIKKAMGPATKNGFYFDFEMPKGVQISSEDFLKLEEEMKKIIEKNEYFHRQIVTISQARQLFQDNPYKQEWIDEIEKKNAIPSIYWTGPALKDLPLSEQERHWLENHPEKLGQEPPSENFLSIIKSHFHDLCQGPHVERSGEIKAFKLLSIAGAYWRGNAKNPMLTRIYGTAFPSQDEMKVELERQEQAKACDHRKLGKELEIFTFEPDMIGSGLPLWLPHGTIIRDELEKLARETERAQGYQRVVTPIIGKEKLYQCSGHLEYFKEDMYAPIMIEEEAYYLRPMNCPHHHHIFKARPRSWRELPLRLAEYGNDFRYESSGALLGLMRTRGFCQNDAHIYCRYDQAEEEFGKVLNLYTYYYQLLGIKDYYMRLSKPSGNREKYANAPEAWNRAIDIVRSALINSRFPFIEVEGEAAFYGPKADAEIKSAIGTEYTISTNQLDFLATEKFDLGYTGKDGQRHPVYVIHRSPLSTHERMVAYLIEHFAGNFPLWLSPLQVAIIPISQDQMDYAHEIYTTLFNKEIRVEIKDEKETMQKRILRTKEQKVPLMLIIGNQEKESRTLSIRTRNDAQYHQIPLELFIQSVKEHIQNRSLEISFPWPLK